ncbi:unnamed protein product [Penicillium salamii]|uniref:DUF7888 domain-containing protein n=1 Tax=Penicillium salamii TaxID=1612424 RepID=A0A9W4JB99_9EURO|nr:unnamed protein product [Penicillium salamii]CAG8097708.1 unnamed protein product [Penicillium salamii]CAG8139268.1 unnamed protein product [Penicillium salamii]CAG8193353.1 unnamed protein product [Penicillium salamii]CAG8296756.1 unnamed protein product [Penicillium salamii]
MLISQLLSISLLGLVAASPVAGGSDSSDSAVAGDFSPDWDAFESDFKLALEEYETNPTLAKRLNTHSASNVGYGQAIYAAGSAAVSQVKKLSDWNKAREQFVQLVTQGMMDHNPDPKTAVAAICYNKDYGIKDPQGIYGLRSEDLSIWPASTE